MRLNPELGIAMTFTKQGNEPAGYGGDQYTGLDRFGRLMDSRWINSAGMDVDRFGFGYNRASNRLWRKNLVAGSAQDEFYGYDALYQLRQLERGTLNTPKTGIAGTPAWEEDFTYDPVGNWDNYLKRENGSTSLNQDRTHNVANELTAIGGSSSLLGYDAAGNMTRAPRPGDASSVYTLIWDAWNRLISVSDGSAAVATYAYDGLTRRAVKETPLEVRHYYYSNKWQIVEERTGSSATAERQFVWGLRDADDLVLRDVFGAASQRLYTCRNGMHVTAVADNIGAIRERYGYEVFGTTVFLTPVFGMKASSSFDWETTFSGYRWDIETGFYQVRYRYLCPTLGRWLSRDPSGERGGINLYDYVLNNPVGYIDPLGLSIWSDIGDVVGGAAIGGLAGGASGGLTTGGLGTVSGAIAGAITGGVAGLNGAINGSGFGTIAENSAIGGGLAGLAGGLGELGEGAGLAANIGVGALNGAMNSCPGNRLKGALLGGALGAGSGMAGNYLGQMGGLEGSLTRGLFGADTELGSGVIVGGANAYW